MTLTNDEIAQLADEFATGDLAQRRPISDVGAWLNELHPMARPALQALGELLAGVSDHDRAETADRFTARALGVTDCGQLVDETRDLNAVSRLTSALALGEWINDHEHVCQIGPGEYSNPPMWTQTEIGGEQYRHPLCLRVHFPAGSLLPDTGCVIKVETRESYSHSAEVSAYVRPEHQTAARVLLDRLADRANALNPYRGRALRATNAYGLQLSVIDLPTAVNRSNVIVPQSVWTEVDLGIAAVRDCHGLLNAHGLGARRGVLLCGPPGTGKSAVSAVAAGEVVGDFTVIYVEAQAGAELLTVVVEEAQRLGGPVLLVLEDVDLWCRDRSAGGGGLSELLQAMDIASDARILTLASTNDVGTLDKAAIRTGRFDSVVEVGYPDRVGAGRILSAFLDDLPGGAGVNTEAVAAALPERTSGSDIREIIRRALLAGNGEAISTAALLAEVGTGRYRAEPPGGMYL